MYLYLFLIGLFSTEARSYVLVQVSKDEQNRSNVDALIHKVVPSEHYDRIAAKFARKQFNKPASETTLAPLIKVEEKDTREALEIPLENGISKSIREFLEKKPVFRTKSFEIKPETVHFRSKPSLVYEINTNSLIKAMNDMLSSRVVSNYTDRVARRAALVYRTIQDI